MFFKSHRTYRRPNTAQNVEYHVAVRAASNVQARKLFDAIWRENHDVDAPRASIPSIRLRRLDARIRAEIGIVD